MSLPENDPLEETRLLLHIAAGDRAAFRQLYARYSGPLFSLAVRLVGDAGAAEEALQDTFVKIWRRAADYDARKSRPFTWAVTILRRVCIDQLRRQGRAPALDSFRDSAEAAHAIAVAETVRETTEAHETSTRVQETLATFPAPQRDVMNLALFSTLTHAEIAQRLGQPLGSVKTWIRRGLLALRNTLQEPTSLT